ncbi:MAG: hypothetical protein MZU97_06875 [Bacillus subtilis]|nr:hypothetical protein [Bacillus subtilis]
MAKLACLIVDDTRLRAFHTSTITPASGATDRSNCVSTSNSKRRVRAITWIEAVGALAG